MEKWNLNILIRFTFFRFWMLLLEVRYHDNDTDSFFFTKPSPELKRLLGLNVSMWTKHDLCQTTFSLVEFANEKM